MSFPIIPDSPYGERGYLRGIDPHSDEHEEKAGFKIGYFSVEDRRHTMHVYVLSGRTTMSLWRHIPMIGNPLAPPRPMDRDDWRIAYIEIPGLGVPTGSVHPENNFLPAICNIRAALEVVGPAASPLPTEADIAASIEAEGERLYASSYGLGQ